MKTQNTRLQFGKNSIIELNDKTLQQINGGTGTVCEYLISAAVDFLIGAAVDHMNNGTVYSGYMDQHGKL